MENNDKVFTKEKYIDPFTDFGFKKLFGEECNKDLLLDFLNELLHKKEGKIVSITYLRSEQLGRSKEDRMTIFDLHCENEKGEKFIVEMQKTKQTFFKDRTLYYSTFPIVRQAIPGDWNYELKAVYMVAILDFVFNEDKNDPDKYRYDIMLTDIETHKIFYHKLLFTYLEMPKFNKTVEELETRFEKWMYVLKNLKRLDSLPEKLRERIFEKMFAAAEIAKLSHEEYEQYLMSLKSYRDWKNSMDTAKEEAEAKGLEKGLAKGEKIGIEKGEKIGIEKGEKIGIEKGEKIGLEKTFKAVRLLKTGTSIEDVSKATGLPIEQIEQLSKEINSDY